jgi:uncharacterized protein with GYD domain
MAKYLVKVSHNADEIDSLLKEGASSRKKTVEELVAPMGGKLETFYYAYGNHAVYYISGIPDDTTAAALELTLNRSGLLTCTTLVPISSQDIDEIEK